MGRNRCKEEEQQDDDVALTVLHVYPTAEERYHSLDWRKRCECDWRVEETETGFIVVHGHLVQ